MLTAPLGPARPVQGGGGSCLEPIAVTSRPYLCTGVDVSPPPPSAHALPLWSSSLDLAHGRRAPCGRCPRDLLVSAPCCGDGIMREPGCRVHFHVLVEHSHPCLDRSWRLVTRDKEVCKANSATRPGRGGEGVPSMCSAAHAVKCAGVGGSALPRGQASPTQRTRGPSRRKDRD